MTNLASLFDSYSRQARLYPALISILPAIGIGLSILPSLAGSVGGTLVAIAGSCGLVFLLADMARSRGKRKRCSGPTLSGLAVRAD
jgi:hypothetical protein